MTNLRKNVTDMVGKSANADNADDALKFSQAALNSAQALHTLGDASERGFVEPAFTASDTSDSAA